MEQIHEELRETLKELQVNLDIVEKEILAKK